MLVDALLVQYLVTYQSEELGQNALLECNLHFVLHSDIAEAKTIVAVFNEQVKAIVNDGTFNRILELNWIKADIDGDVHLEVVLEGDKAGIDSPASTHALLYAGDELADNSSSSYYI